MVECMRKPFQYGAELKPGQIVNRKQEQSVRLSSA
jgi:hypothetical protein